MVTPAHRAVDAIVVEEEIVFSLSEFCRATATTPDEVSALVVEGVLEPSGDRPDEWTFPGPSLRTARAALRLARDLELGVSGAALVLQLLQEIEVLRSRLRTAGLE